MPQPKNSDLLERLIKLEEKFNDFLIQQERYKFMDEALRNEIGTFGKIVLEIQETIKEMKELEAERRGAEKYKLYKSSTPWYKDPTVMRVVTLLAIALLLLVGAAVGTDVVRFL